MDTGYDIYRQELNESLYSRKGVDREIRAFVSEHTGKIEECVQLINEYMSKSYYASKNLRVAQLHGLDIRELAESILVGVAYFFKEELFANAVAILAGRLGFSDKAEAATTVGELLAVMCNSDLFDIYHLQKEGRKVASLYIKSRIKLPDSLIEAIERSTFLPPMVCKPLELETNYCSGYLSIKESLILKKNHHDGDIALDVLNICNSVALSLDTDFLSTVEEEPSFELDDRQKADNWMAFKRQSYQFYQLLAKQGNNFYLTHKVDKRGRIYASGYHITTQGSAFKKASIELAKKEIVTGDL